MRRVGRGGAGAGVGRRLRMGESKQLGWTTLWCVNCTPSIYSGQLTKAYSMRCAFARVKCAAGLCGEQERVGVGLLISGGTVPPDLLSRVPSQRDPRAQLIPSPFCNSPLSSAFNFLSPPPSDISTVADRIQLVSLFPSPSQALPL